METKNKTFKIDVRVSSDEYTNIKKMSDKLGMTMSAYMRSTALNHTIIIKTDIDVARQIRYIGNNINQIARHLNTYSDDAIILTASRQMEEYKELLQIILDKMGSK